MQLRHDHTLGTIDDEGTVVGHQGHFAHVDFLLFDVLNGFGGRFFIVNNQADFDAQRRCKSHTAQHTFFFVECRLAETVAYVFQCRITGVTDNWKNRFKCCMKTNVAACFSVLTFLKKLVVGVNLDCQQVRHVHDARKLTKILTDTFFLSI